MSLRHAPRDAPACLLLAVVCMSCGMRQPALTKLLLPHARCRSVLATHGSGALLTGPSVYSGLQQLSLGIGMPGSMYDATTMPQLVRCCPELRRLELHAVWNCEAAESLSRLRHLSSLHIQTGARLTDAHVEALVSSAAPGRLQELGLDSPECAITDVGLLQLTRCASARSTMHRLTALPLLLWVPAGCTLW